MSKHLLLEKKKLSFFFIMACVGILAVLIGFAKTYFIPMSNHTFKAPTSVHIHGAFAFTWILLFMVQTSLIHIKNYRLHMALGYFGIFVALGVTITMIPAALFAVEKELLLGFGKTAYSGLLGVTSSGLLFFVLVLAGVWNRNKPQHHKRLMLLATIVVLWPAWFRFRHYFPSIPHPEIWFALVLADSLIIIAWIWDKVKNGSIHPALKYVGGFVLLFQICEVLVFDMPFYQVVAENWYHILTQ